MAFAAFAAFPRPAQWLDVHPRGCTAITTVRLRSSFSRAELGLPRPRWPLAPALPQVLEPPAFSRLGDAPLFGWTTFSLSTPLSLLWACGGRFGALLSILGSMYPGGEFLARALLSCGVSGVAAVQFPPRLRCFTPAVHRVQCLRTPTDTRSFLLLLL